MGKGITPIVTVVILVGVVIAMASTAVMFISDQQDFVIDESKKAQLETVNITCSRQTVTWWIENKAKYGVNDLQAEVFFNENGVHNGTLFMQDEPVPSSLTAGTTTTKLFFPTPRPLKLGQHYTIELDMTDSSVSGACTAGEQWWNVNWDHRRRINVEGNTNADGNTTIQLDTKQLVQEGKLKPYCQDLRIVINGERISHGFSSSPTNCATRDNTNITFHIDDPSVAEYTTYLYYGNPGADNPYTEKLDLHYVIDGSASFYDEWDTLEDNIDDINTQLEEQAFFDMASRAWSFNNSYSGDANPERVCMTTQTLPDSFNSTPYCDRRYSIIQDIAHMNPYFDWLNTRHSTSITPATYNPWNVTGSGTNNNDNGESPLEGWGPAILDVFERGTWRANANKAILVVADHDTNGGTYFNGADTSCGDSNSEALAQYIATEAVNRNIRIFSLLGDPECEDDPSDGQHASYAERQMNMTGEVERYTDASQLVDRIVDALGNLKTVSSAPLSSMEQEERIGLPGQ